MQLEGKVAIVTGAARGTGAAIARRLVAEGARVWLGDVLEAEGRAVATELGAAARFALHDVTRRDDWERVVAAALARHGRVDVLVNNAARLHLGTLERTSEDVLRALLEVNTIGPYLGMRAVLAPMKQQGGGSIVNVGSIDSLLGMNGVSAYAASKWALRGMTKSAAMELGRDGIRVNSVCPAGGNPAMYGPWMQQLVGFLDQTRAYRENRGIPGEAPPDQIAQAVVFFASDASRHCTGVDCRWTAATTRGGSSRASILFDSARLAPRCARLRQPTRDRVGRRGAPPLAGPARLAPRCARLRQATRGRVGRRRAPPLAGPARLAPRCARLRQPTRGRVGRRRAPPLAGPARLAPRCARLRQPTRDRVGRRRAPPLAGPARLAPR